jgi:hypothetical protein
VVRAVLVGEEEDPSADRSLEKLYPCCLAKIEMEVQVEVQQTVQTLFLMEAAPQEEMG